MTGGRLKRVAPYLGADDFCLTYGDGLCDINIHALLEFHKEQGRLATVTAIQPAGRFGALVMKGANVTAFAEKPRGDGAWINGGFFVLNPKVIEHIEDDATIWEREPLEALAGANQLVSFQHHGFWQPMDTLRDKIHLEELWASGQAPWKTW
jgi:glucose-1-phosphate cytidylyltransferase